MEYPSEGIATDAAHSMKNGITQFRGIDLKTKQQIFIQEPGNQTVNIGEFLAVVEAARYIIETAYTPPVIYTDSQTAITWWKNKKTASRKNNTALKKAEIFLKAFSHKIDTIKVIHWQTNQWGEIPADFGNK